MQAVTILFFTHLLCTAPPPVLSPPKEVRGHCSHVNWRNSPDVSCNDIIGYDVMLSNPETGVKLTRRVDALGTFHNFLSSDRILTLQASTAVQVDLGNKK